MCTDGYTKKHNKDCEACASALAHLHNTYVLVSIGVVLTLLAAISWRVLTKVKTILHFIKVHLMEVTDQVASSTKIVLSMVQVRLRSGRFREAIPVAVC